ncbi:surface polysaccharide O-acyltransferase-like enzyme [Planomicrobium koreense]|uniref:Surface polysaccharide O-acyltransferase-like enzyme n=1 Tax=Planococcus koreensis TaxID=112331 RepID=A0A7W8CQ39_9BACL|nr:acyltransferase family protein [Planococcus koreensis]MBB5179401.1 surface polysaccharide O-acyltransferase-like enzyme [Planococcus koreensis]
MAQRFEYMDWLRVLAIFTVVGIHVLSKIINAEPPEAWEWQLANAMDSATRWCVPVFFMLSGALLLTKKPDEPVWSFLRKRLAKAFIPLVFWSGIYLLYRILEQGRSYTAGEAITLFLTDDVYFHLWFLYTIIGLYLMAPFLRILVDRMTQKTFLYFLGFWFLFSVLMPFINRFLGFDVAFKAGMFEPYIGYFMLGAYLFLYPIPKKYLPHLAAAAFLGYIGTYIGTEGLSDYKGELDEFFYEHYRPNSLAITLFVFTLFQHLEGRLKANKLITRISAATLGIYVIHPLIQYYLDKYLSISPTMFHPALAIPITWIIIFIVSYAIIRVLQKLPGVKHLVP